MSSTRSYEEHSFALDIDRVIFGFKVDANDALNRDLFTDKFLNKAIITMVELMGKKEGVVLNQIHIITSRDLRNAVEHTKTQKNLIQTKFDITNEASLENCKTHKVVENFEKAINKKAKTWTADHKLIANAFELLKEYEETEFKNTSVEEQGVDDLSKEYHKNIFLLKAAKEIKPVSTEETTVSELTILESKTMCKGRYLHFIDDVLLNCIAALFAQYQNGWPEDLKLNVYFFDFGEDSIVPSALCRLELDIKKMGQNKFLEFAKRINTFGSFTDFMQTIEEIKPYLMKSKVIAANEFGAHFSCEIRFAAEISEEKQNNVVARNDVVTEAGLWKRAGFFDEDPNYALNYWKNFSR